MSEYSLIYGKVFRANIDKDVFDYEKEIKVNPDGTYKNIYSGKDWIMFFDEASSFEEYFVVPDFRKFNERAHELNKKEGINIDLYSGLKVIEFYYNGADAPHVENETYEDFRKMKR